MEAYCIRCKKSYTEYPALSRRDNKTSICSACGCEEGINDWQTIIDIPIDCLKVEKEFQDKIGIDYTGWLKWKYSLELELDK
jgi:hypothetical protein